MLQGRSRGTTHSPPYGAGSGSAGALDAYGPIVSQRRGNASRFYHPSVLGTIETLTGADAATTDTYILDAWGVQRASTGSTTNPFRYVGALGYYTEPDLGLAYVRARWLRPGTGSWLSLDPVEGEARYAYVGSSPTGRADPAGLEFPPTLEDLGLGALKLPAQPPVIPSDVQIGPGWFGPLYTMVQPIAPACEPTETYVKCWWDCAIAEWWPVAAGSCDDAFFAGVRLAGSRCSKLLAHKGCKALYDLARCYTTKTMISATGAIIWVPLECTVNCICCPTCPSEGPIPSMGGTIAAIGKAIWERSETRRGSTGGPHDPAYRIGPMPAY